MRIENNKYFDLGTLRGRIIVSFICAAVMLFSLVILSPYPFISLRGVFMPLALAIMGGGVVFFATLYLKSLQHLLVVALTLGAGMLIRQHCLEFMSEDYVFFLQPWAEEFRQYGIQAIADTKSNYNMPYLYIIGIIARIPANDLHLYKLVSIAFDCGLVVVALKIAQIFSFGEIQKTVLAGAIFLAPTVWLNSALWTQCDAIYAFFCLLALAFALEQKPAATAAMAAIAFSFKLQAVFLLPIFIVLLISKRIKVMHSLVFVGVFLLVMLPSWLIGRPFIDIIGVYVSQAQQYQSALALNAPSIYALLPDGISNAELLSVAGIIFAIGFLFALCLLAIYHRERITNKSIFLFSTAMVIGIPYFLPRMHERYFFMADIFCIILAVMIPGKWYVAPLCILASYVGYGIHLFGRDLPNFGLAGGAFVFMFLLVTVCLLLWKEFSKKQQA